jgi:hypothetical protein
LTGKITLKTRIGSGFPCVKTFFVEAINRPHPEGGKNVFRKRRKNVTPKEPDHPVGWWGIFRSLRSPIGNTPWESLNPYRETLEKEYQEDEMDHS